MRVLHLAAALLLLLSGAAVAAERTLVLAVGNMTCALCPVTVAKAIEGVEGVLAVSVDFDAKRAVVRYDTAVATVEGIAEASGNAGYPASEVE